MLLRTLDECLLLVRTHLFSELLKITIRHTHRVLMFFGDGKHLLIHKLDLFAGIPGRRQLFLIELLHIKELLLLLNELLSYILIEVLGQLIRLAIPPTAQHNIIDDRAAQIFDLLDALHAVGQANVVIVPNSFQLLLSF